jgi:hypothetical protein
VRSIPLSQVIAAATLQDERDVHDFSADLPLSTVHNAARRDDFNQMAGIEILRRIFSAS